FPSVCSRVCNHPCEQRCRAGQTGDSSIAIRTLKRFVTDRVDPSVYEIPYTEENGRDDKVAIIGSGPSGLTAAHYLSRKGYKVTVVEADSKPGGMLVSTIPSYRLPREVLEKEIESILSKNVTVKCSTEFGKDVTLEGLQKDGYKAVYLALGAHKSRKLGIPNEDVTGVYPSIEFLKEFNLNGKNLVK
ncbi:MAG: FAD-dependent oxidoreductase, partial [bacterium]|nr:FAD-dependent oxidoreductase [bacterium]